MTAVTPHPVLAAAAPEYGAGALLGLVAGASLRADGSFAEVAPAIVGQCAAVVASLTARGHVDLDDLDRRFDVGAPPMMEQLPLLAVPLALFHADDFDALAAGVLALAARLEADAATTLAAISVAAALAAATGELGDPEVMALAGVQAIDAVAAAHAASRPDMEAARTTLRDDFRHAVVSAFSDAVPDGATPLSQALRLAFWHVVSEHDLASAVRDVARRDDALAAALTGLLIGAAHGAESIPAAWQAALASRSAPLLALLRPRE